MHRRRAARGGKDFLFVVQTMARFGNNICARCDANGQRFDLRTPSKHGLHDRFMPANVYYKDTGLSWDFYRGSNGQPGWVRPPGDTDLTTPGPSPPHT